MAPAEWARMENFVILSAWQIAYTSSAAVSIQPSHCILQNNHVPGQLSGVVVPSEYGSLPPTPGLSGVMRRSLRVKANSS